MIPEEYEKRSEPMKGGVIPGVLFPSKAIYIITINMLRAPGYS